MKKFLLILLALVMCLSVCACGETQNTKDESDSNDASAVESSQEVSEESKIDPELQARLDNVVSLVDAIGEITVDSGEAILKAEKEYKTLSDEEKQMVKESGKKLSDARKDFENLVTLIAESDKVEELISAIKLPELITSKSKIDAARKAYNALSSEAKKLVENYQDLENAESANAAAVQAEIQKIDTYKAKFEADVDKVEGLTWYMHKNMPDYIDIRSYIIPYIGVRDGNEWICVRYNYTGDDWVFWESLTIVVDGKKTTKYVGYFNTTRDNSGGDVWEFYDDVLDVKEPMDSSSIALLRDIAYSEETIIRFQGDDYHYDLTVSSTDKAIIIDVLNLYQAMLLE